MSGGQNVRRWWPLFFAALILGAACGLGLYLTGGPGGPRFHQTTIIGEIDVSGMNSKEAAEALAGVRQEFALCRYCFTCEDSSCQQPAGKIGASLDVQGFVECLLERQQGERGRFGFNPARTDVFPLEIPVVYDRGVFDRTLAPFFALAERRAENPRMNWAGGTPIIVPGSKGLRLDREKTFKQLPAYYRGESVLNCAVAAEEEEITVDAGQVSGLVSMGSASTWFNAGNINRTSNLKMAAQALEGVVIPPGAEFSFNNSVGPRELDKGYKEAMVILKNEFTPGVGGGVCQVSSTLYNACLLSGLQIVERHNHSVAVPYVAPGLDATVAFPVKDFRFKNDTASLVVIRTGMAGSRLSIAIYGSPAEKRRVELSRVVDSSVQFAETRKPDPTLPLGEQKVVQEGVNGFKVRIYRLFYDEAGQLLSRQMASADTYSPLKRMVLVGTVPVPAAETPAAAEPAEPDTAGGLPVEEAPVQQENGGLDAEHAQNQSSP